MPEALLVPTVSALDEAEKSPERGFLHHSFLVPSQGKEAHITSGSLGQKNYRAGVSLTANPNITCESATCEGADLPQPLPPSCLSETAAHRQGELSLPVLARDQMPLSNFIFL